MERSKKVADVMSVNPVRVKETEFATKARALFRSYRYRSMPVVDEENKVVGVITRGDIIEVTSTKSNVLVSGLMSTPRVILTPEEDLRSAARKMIDASVESAVVVRSSIDNTLVGMISLHDILPYFKEAGKNKLAKEIMTKEVVSCTPDDGIPKVLDKMEKMKFTGLPVVKDGKLVGIITRKDIIDAGFARISREGKKGKVKNPPKVKRLMKTPVISVSPNTTVAEVIRIILEHNIGRVPVVENKRLVGIITRKDIIKSFLL